MKLYYIVGKVLDRLECASEEEIVAIINSLESKIVANIFAPAGIESEERVLIADEDMEANLLLSADCENLYYYYIMTILSAKSMDIEGYENYRKLFDSAYSELAVYVRRNNKPVMRTKIGGSNI